MNLILLREEERRGSGCATLRGDRARHLQRVIGCRPGQALRIGIPNGPTGQGRVLAVEEGEVRLSMELDGPVPPRPDVSVILALPRPKALRRIIEHLATLGIRRLLVTRSWRVEKSYRQSRLTGDDVVREAVWSGLEQACDTWVPDVRFFDRFRPFVEDELDAALGDGQRFVLHPQAARTLSEVNPTQSSPVAVAIGPEGGWTDFEVSLFRDHGFTDVALGTRILRVETACTAVLAQLAVLRQGPSISRRGGAPRSDGDPAVD